MQPIIDIFNTILIAPLVNALFFIYSFLPGHDFGISIIVLTILIRLMLWPLANKQLHSQKKMLALQGDISKIKQKAAGDKQKESAMLMELYKQKEVNPFSACLPTLFQLPILIAMFVVFQQAIGSIANVEKLLYEPVKNLAYIQQIITGQIAYNTNLLGIVNMATPNYLIAIIAGITQFIQVKMISPKKQKTDTKDSQAQMMAMMNYTFPALTVFIAWTLPAALPVYWITTNGVSILQQWLVMNKEVDAMEEMDVVKIIRKGANTSPTKKLGKPTVKTKITHKGKK